MSLIRSHILVCTGTGCTSSESPKIIAEFEKQLAAQGMDKEAQVVRTGCFGLCALGPIVTIYPEGACYTHVTVDDVEEIVAEHIVKGRIVKRLLNKNEGGDGPATSLAETRFYKHQHRIALRNCGVINPESIDEYIGVDGYAALGKILTEHIPPQQVIDTVLASGLRALGLRVLDGRANYLLFQGPETLGETLRQKGVVLRSCANYPGLDGSWYRTAVRTAAENEQLLQTLSEVFS